MKRLIITISLLLFSYSFCFSALEPTNDLQSTIWNAQPGNSLTISSAIAYTQDFLSFQIKDSGPKLVFSDDPEYLKAPGICGQETIGPETVRLYLYNVNATKNDDFKFALVLRNLSLEMERVVIMKQGSQKPSEDYANIGRKSLLEFYKSNLKKEFTISPKKSALLDTYWENMKVTNQALAHGFYEFYCSQSTQITLCGLNWNDTTLETYSSLSILPSNHKNAGRGTFFTSNRQFIILKPYDTKNGIQKIRLADGQIDTWVKGFDHTSGKETQLAGNYGVLYNIEIPVYSSDSQDLAILVMSQPSGISGCSYSGVIGTKEKNNQTSSGYFLTPADRYAFVNATTASLVGIYKTSPTSETITLEFSPPGASCLPADLILVPLNRKQ